MDWSHLSNVGLVAEFTAIAFIIVMLVMFLMKHVGWIAAIVLPFHDELEDVAKRFMEREKITQAEATVALALAFVSGLTILGVMIFLSDVATFLG